MRPGAKRPRAEDSEVSVRDAGILRRSEPWPCGPGAKRPRAEDSEASVRDAGILRRSEPWPCSPGAKRPRAEDLEVADGELGHLPFGCAAHHLLHHLELLEQAVHVLRGDSAPLRDARPP
jgi:hypothetical protein